MEASSINQPHPDEPREGIEDFFGDGDTPVEEPAAQPAANAIDDFDADPPHDAAAEARVEAEAPTEPEPVVTESQPEPTEPVVEPTEPEAPVTEPEAPVTEDAPVPDPQTPPAPLDPAVDPPEPEPEPGAKTQPRPYLVFQEIVLTEKMLKALLEEYKTSSDPEPRKVYYVMSTELQRTSIGALESAYTANKETLGDEATLVPLTAKSWKPKHIKPKVKTKVSLDIS